MATETEIINAYEKVKKGLRTYVERKLQGNQDVDDIVNAALYKALKYKTSIKSPTPMLYKNCRDGVADFYRFNARIKRTGEGVLLTPHVNVIETMQESPYESNGQLEHFVSPVTKNETLWEAFDSLTEREQKLIKYRVIDSATFIEISKELNVIPWWAGKIFSDALTKLKEEYIRREAA